MSVMETDNDPENLIFEEAREPGTPLRRIGRLKTTGVVVFESRFDEHRREVEKRFFDDDGHLSKRVVYEYDQDRKPRLTTVFDKLGNVKMRQERGKRPELFE